MRTHLLTGLLPQALVRSCLIIALGVTAVPVMAQENPFDTIVDARMGRRKFAAECGRCHGLDAKGNDETGAPDLTTGVFASASTDQGLFNVIRDGIAGTTMIGISWAPAQTIWQIVAYIDSLSLDPGDVDLPGNPDAGRQIFHGGGNCSSCHMVNGSGGRLGPDLSRVGNRRTPDELRTDLADPDQTVEPRWWTVKITLEDGTVVEGLRMNEDTFSIRVMDGEENLWHFKKSQIRSSERIETSTMPSVTDLFTPSEVDDLVAYLFSLRKQS